MKVRQSVSHNITITVFEPICRRRVWTDLPVSYLNPFAVVVFEPICWCHI